MPGSRKQALSFFFVSRRSLRMCFTGKEVGIIVNLGGEMLNFIGLFGNTRQSLVLIE